MVDIAALSILFLPVQVFNKSLIIIHATSTTGRFSQTVTEVEDGGVQ